MTALDLAEVRPLCSYISNQTGHLNEKTKDQIAMKTSLAFAALMLLLTGCSKAPVAEVKTVDWYKAHSAERSAMLKECANNPGEMAKTPNCINAHAADFAATTGPSNVRIK
jgi:hypothetical protein